MEKGIRNAQAEPTFARMGEDEPQAPLTGLQLELLKLYSTEMSEVELHDLKQQLAGYFANKAISTADRLWDEKKLSDHDMDAWLDE